MGIFGMNNMELFERAAKLKTKNGILLFFVLHKSGAIKETSLLKLFRMDAHSLRAVLSLLSNLNYAHFILDKDNITYYMMDKQFYEKGSVFYEKIIKSEKNVKFLNVCENIKKAKTTDQKKVVDIVEHLEKLYAKTFRGLDYPYSTNVTKKFVQELLFIFKKLVKSTVYDNVLKLYLDACFKRMSESAGFNLRKLSDMGKIIKFVDNREDKDSSNALVCTEHGMNCSYFDSEGCRLERDGLSCSDKIREHMKKKYGYKI